MSKAIEQAVRVGSVRLEAADSGCTAVVGDHWEDSRRVVLRVLDAGLSEDFPPGPLPRWVTEKDLARDGGFALYDPAADPPNRVGFTTCEPCYDFGCTLTLETFQCRVYPNESERTWRRVLVLGGSGFSLGQLQRYGSFTDEDPRATRDRFAETVERERRERAEVEARLAADEMLLASMPLDELRREPDRRSEDESWQPVTHDRWEDAKRARRVLERREAEAREAEWAALRTRIPVGRTVLVPAVAPVERTDEWSIRYFGKYIPGTPAYLLEVVGPPWQAAGMPPSKRVVTVCGDDGMEHEMDAAEVARLCELSGVLQDPSRWPTLAQRKKVAARLGKSVLDLHQYGGADGVPRLWVGQPRFSSEWLVLDDDGRVCRKKALAAAAVESAIRAQAAKWARLL